MNEETLVVLYTTAPTDYDGGMTTTLRVAGRDARFGDVREVSLPEDDVDWQAGRYASGMYLALDAKGWAKHVALGLAVAERDARAVSL